MSFNKITDSEMNTHGVIGLPDTPNMSAYDLQRKFDELAIDVLRPAHDTLVDKLESNTAASSIGIKVPSGLSADENIQSVINNLAASNHSHSNKDVIDKLSVNNNDLLFDGKPIISSFEQLPEISIKSPANADVLQFNATTQKWENSAYDENVLADKVVSNGNVKGNSDLTSDINRLDSEKITSPLNPQDEDVLVFDSSDSKWKSTSSEHIKGAQGVGISDVIDNSDGSFKFELTDGTTTKDIETISGKDGLGIADVEMLGAGKEHPIVVTYTDGNKETIGSIRDGNDGAGTGDMQFATYDPTQSGIVEFARALSDGSTTIPMVNVLNKADSADSLAGYGIEDAYTKEEVDKMIEDISFDINVERIGGSGRFITSVAQTNGKLEATEVGMSDIADGTSITVVGNKLRAAITPSRFRWLQDNIAPSWSQGSYPSGSYVMDNDQLYRNNSANATSGVPGVSSDWVETSIADELSGSGIGTSVSIDSGNVNATTGTYFPVANLTIPKGTHIISVRCEFSNTSANDLRVSVNTEPSTASGSSMLGNSTMYARGTGSSNHSTVFQLACCDSFDKNTKVYVNAWHNNGSDLQCRAWVNAVKIAN